MGGTQIFEGLKKSPRGPSEDSKATSGIRQQVQEVGAASSIPGLITEICVSLHDASKKSKRDS